MGLIKVGQVIAVISKLCLPSVAKIKHAVEPDDPGLISLVAAVRIECRLGTNRQFRLT